MIGESATLSSCGVFTDRVALPATAPEVAFMVVLPLAIAFASPVPLIVATDCFDEVHETELVMTAVLPSEYVPVATNCRV